MERSFSNNFVNLHAKIKLRIKEYKQGSEEFESKIIETTVGRSLLSKILPKEISFSNVDDVESVKFKVAILSHPKTFVNVAE